MTKEEIMEISEKCGIKADDSFPIIIRSFVFNFALAIAEKEREACAELIPPQYFHFRDWIRARGKE